jgi:hypothetical protein
MIACLDKARQGCLTNGRQAWYAGRVEVQWGRAAMMARAAVSEITESRLEAQYAFMSSMRLGVGVGDMDYVHSHGNNSGQVTTSSVVKASFLQHIAMPTTNGSNMRDYMWVEQSGVCGGE